MMKLRAVSHLLALTVACVLVANKVARAQIGPVPITPGSWTMAILPDTQHYTQTYPEVVHAQTQFLAAYKDTLNIKMVLQEGDITNTSSVAEWENASNAFATLEAAGVPYTIAQGNHDIGPGGNASVRTSLFSTYFSPARLAGQPTFGGVYPGIGGVEANKSDNNYSLFSAGGTDYIAFALEFGPRDEVIDWVGATLKANPGRTGMIVTHAYLYYDSTRYDWDTKGSSQSWNPHAYGVDGQPGGVNDGEEMWQSLKDNANLKYIFNGHVLEDASGYLVSEADDGHSVHQMLANFQTLTNGGQGYMRLLEFKPDGQTIEVRTFSPWLDSQGLPSRRTEEAQQFTVNINAPPAPNPVLYQAVGANLVVSGPASTTNEDRGDLVTVVGTTSVPMGTLQTNRGDYEVSVFREGIKFQQGVMLASITEHVRDGVRATVEAGRDPYSDGFMSLSVTQAGSGGGEVNMNTAVAWFEFAGGWQGAHVNANGTVAVAHGAVMSQASLVKAGAGRYTLDLGVDSRTDGMLFAIGNNNSNTIVPTGVLTDGSGWDLRVQTNTANFAATGVDRDFSFLYLPYDTENLIGGRYDGIGGASLASAGAFTMERLATGQYKLTIPGETPDSGMLIMSVAYLATSGVTAPDDNILTYQTDGLGSFLIESRDLAGLGLQDTQFVWAFLDFSNPMTQPLPFLAGDVNKDGAVDIFDVNLVSDHWGGSGPAGDANGDGSVDIFDVNLISDQWGQLPGGAAAVPEPSTWLLGAACSIASLIVRRRAAR